MVLFVSRKTWLEERDEATVLFVEYVFAGTLSLPLTEPGKLQVIALDLIISLHCLTSNCVNISYKKIIQNICNTI